MTASFAALLLVATRLTIPFLSLTFKSIFAYDTNEPISYDYLEVPNVAINTFAVKLAIF